LAYSSTLKTEQNVPPKLRLTFNGLHKVISQTIELFKAITVRTSDPRPKLKFVREFSGWFHGKKKRVPASEVSEGRMLKREIVEQPRPFISVWHISDLKNSFVSAAYIRL
jgi:hypothetical protein